jgi:hypothetical protein
MRAAESIDNITATVGKRVRSFSGQSENGEHSEHIEQYSQRMQKHPKPDFNQILRVYDQERDLDMKNLEADNVAKTKYAIELEMAIKDLKAKDAATIKHFVNLHEEKDRVIQKMVATIQGKDQEIQDLVVAYQGVVQEKVLAVQEKALAVQEKAAAVQEKIAAVEEKDRAIQDAAAARQTTTAAINLLRREKAAIYREKVALHREHVLRIPIIDKVYTSVTDIMMSGMTVAETTASAKDGRVSAILLTQWIKTTWNVHGTLQIKVFTKNGVIIAPSKNIGTGRSIKNNEIIQKIHDHQTWCFIDTREFPNIRYVFKTNTSVLRIYRDISHNGTVTDFNAIITTV